MSANCVEMDEFLDKKYLQVDSENFEDYLKFIGLGYFARKVALTLKQTVKLSRKEDGSYTFEFISPLATSAIDFTLGEEFEEVRPDGVKMRSVITIEGNVMTHVQKYENGTTCTHVREFYPEKMISTTSGEGLNKTIIRRYETQN